MQPFDVSRGCMLRRVTGDRQELGVDSGVPPPSALGFQVGKPGIGVPIESSGCTISRLMVTFPLPESATEPSASTTVYVYSADPLFPDASIVTTTLIWTLPAKPSPDMSCTMVKAAVRSPVGCQIPSPTVPSDSRSVTTPSEVNEVNPGTPSGSAMIHVPMM